MNEQFVGFYWTLPVNWAGFRQLPDNVEAAAAASRTIRYQRERVRRYVARERGTLINEIAFMDVRPDRATDVVQQELQRKVARYKDKATLVAVAFDDVHLWRHNPYLRIAAKKFGLEFVAVPPDPVTIDGIEFNPIEHFKDWREQDASTKTRLEYEAHQGLQAGLVEVPAGNGRWQAIAERLNTQGIKTIRGGTWTPENVRKLAGRIGGLSSQASIGAEQETKPV